MSEPTLLVIDVGNTNVSLGIYDYEGGAGQNSQGHLSHHWRLSTHREQTSDEVVISISSLFASEERSPSEVTDVILSSVVPPVVPIWERVCSKIFGQLPQIVGPGMRTGMPVRYENPHEVGADRIVNAVAAFELYGGPIIAVDSERRRPSTASPRKASTWAGSSARACTSRWRPSSSGPRSCIGSKSHGPNRSSAGPRPAPSNPGCCTDTPASSTR